MSETPTENSTPAQKPKRELGIVGIIGSLIGAGCLFIALLGVPNTAFEWEVKLRVYGSRMELPDNYETCAGLAVAGILLIALSFFGSQVAHRFGEAKGKPLVRVAIIVAAVAFLAVAGRGLQILALTNTYGSMVAYYATDGDLEDVKAELAKGPEPEDLDRAVGRAAQYDNAPALKLLLEAGADLRDKTRPAKQRRCALNNTGLEFIKIALDHGVKPKTCPDSKTLIWKTVSRKNHDDKTTAKIVTMLAKAGWSPTRIPKGQKRTPVEVAQDLKRPKTVKALKAAAK